MPGLPKASVVNTSLQRIVRSTLGHKQEIYIECLVETASVSAKSVHDKQQTRAPSGSWRGGHGYNRRGRGHQTCARQVHGTRLRKVPPSSPGRRPCSRRLYV